MKLWRIQRTDPVGYDEYDAAIVAAPSEADARLMHPGVEHSWNGEEWGYIHPREGWAMVRDTGWVAPSVVVVTEIGEATEGTPPGVILASFNPG